MAKTILIVDDENETQRLLKLIFERAKYQVLVAPNSAAATKMILKHQPDVVIVDDLMPGISGLELCHWVTNNAATRHIPVIILSAGTQAIDADDLEQVGAFAALRKPYEPRKLLATVESSLAAGV